MLKKYKYFNSKNLNNYFPQTKITLDYLFFIFRQYKLRNSILFFFYLLYFFRLRQGVSLWFFCSNLKIITSLQNEFPVVCYILYQTFKSFFFFSNTIIICWFESFDILFSLLEYLEELDFSCFFFFFFFNTIMLPFFCFLYYLNFIKESTSFVIYSIADIFFWEISLKKKLIFLFQRCIIELE